MQKREIGLRNAEKSGFDIVILDDGLQDYKIKRTSKLSASIITSLLVTG